MFFMYKGTETTAQLFKPEPKKVFKVFITFFGIAFILSLALSWYTTHQLGTSNIPDESSMNFQNAKSVLFFCLNLSFIVLIVLSNAYSLSLKKLSPLPYFLTLFFYCTFILLDAYQISNYFLIWQNSLKLFKGDFPDFHTMGWAKCGFGVLVTAFNAGLIWWGLRK
jgi:hypothetical protein